MPQQFDSAAKSVLQVPPAARELLRAILVHGPTTRADLVSRLNLSAASLTRLGAPLLQQTLLAEGELISDGNVGRPLRLLDVRADAGHFAGLKVTGAEIFAVITDLRAEPVISQRVKLHDRAVETVVGQVCAVVEAMEVQTGIQVNGVGISLGGSVADGATVLRAPFLGWRNVQLAAKVQDLLHRPVALENDVQALTVAQQWFGAGRRTENFAVLTIGAGVGYGLVLNDRLIESADWGLGLIGHFPIDPSGPQCVAGHRGCARAFLTIESICTLAAQAYGEPLDYADVLRRAADGHRQLGQLVTQAGRALGILAAAVANLTGVKTIVLSGEGIGLFLAVEPTVRAAAAERRDPEAAELDFLPTPDNLASSDFAEWARGAAAVAIERTLLGVISR